MNNSLTSTHPSATDEARSLVRLCAEPRPAGDQVKAAILRASRRLQFAFNRTKDIWYGDARRIDAEEMDRLRLVAEKMELTHTITRMEALCDRMRISSSPASREVLVGLTAALNALGRDPCGSGQGE